MTARPSSRVGHREVAAQRSARRAWGERRRRRRPRLEAGSLPFTSAYGQSDGISAPHRISSHASVGFIAAPAAGSALGPLRAPLARRDVRGNPRILPASRVHRLCVRCLHSQCGERANLDIHFGARRPSNQGPGKTQLGAGSNSCRSEAARQTASPRMKSNVPGTGVIRRLLMERTSILTLPSARGERRASPHDCRVALDGGMSGNGEAARVHEAGREPRTYRASSGARFAERFLDLTD